MIKTTIRFVPSFPVLSNQLFFDTCVLLAPCISSIDLIRLWCDKNNTKVKWLINANIGHSRVSVRPHFRLSFTERWWVMSHQSRFWTWGYSKKNRWVRPGSSQVWMLCNRLKNRAQPVSGFHSSCRAFVRTFGPLHCRFFPPSGFLLWVVFFLSFEGRYLGLESFALTRTPELSHGPG